MLKSLFVDISPLRESREYRLLFSGQVVSSIGRQMTIVASAIQIFDLTGNTLAVGLLGLAQFPATVTGSFLGGTLADAFDRRIILMVAQVFLAATTAGLALNAMAAEPQVWIVYALVMLNAFGSSVDAPARNASVPKMVGAHILPAALTLNVVIFQVAASIGPAIGGALIADADVAAAYWVDTMTFGAALVALFFMKPLRPAGGGTRPGFRSIGEGLRFLRSSKPLQGIFIIDIVAMVFGMPRALFPEWGTELLGGDEATVGLLYAAPAFGSLIGGLLSGPISRIRSSGRATVVAVFTWGMAITVFGFSSSIVIAVTSLGIAGAADSFSSIFRNTILQVTTPDRLRGRLSAVQIAVVSGGPRVGDAEAGAAASLIGLRAAAWTGGLLSAAGALVVAALVPAFSRWRVPDDVDLDEGA